LVEQGSIGEDTPLVARHLGVVGGIRRIEDDITEVTDVLRVLAF